MQFRRIIKEKRKKCGFQTKAEFIKLRFGNIQIGSAKTNIKNNKVEEAKISVRSNCSGDIFGRLVRRFRIIYAQA